ncbi:kinase-like domain-containing protein [Hyaloraphidium curvatum]|nr:kinase-like domain-containing protein [Hyaloraphidium curvatum]
MAPLPANRRKLVRESDVHVEWAVALGEGGFGKVFAGQFQFMDVAVKVAKDRSTSGGSPGSSTSSTRSLADEIKVWGELSPHDHVVPLIGYCNESRLMIITKLYKGGNLLTYLSRQSPAYDLGLSVKLLAQTAAGLSFIHSQVPRMLHGDLKAENVLVDVPEGGGDPIAKIADFGLAKEGASMDSSGHFASANASSSARFSSPAGATLRFAPPEFFNSAGFSRASDVWTFGMLAYEVLSGGNPPYHNVPNWDVPNKIRAGETPTKPARVPHDLWNIVRSCWKREASQRPPASDIARRLFSLAEQPEYRPRRT